MNRCCSACGEELTPGAISETLEAARCRRCGVLQDLRSGKRIVRVAAIRYPVPERWKVEEAIGRLHISWRLIGWMVLPLTLFTAFWDGLLLFAGRQISHGFQHPEQLLWGLVIPHVWVGIGLAYFVLGLWLNTTRIQAGGEELTVKTGPLPWRGNRRFTKQELQQLFVVERHGPKGSVRYELCAVTRDGRRKTVLRLPREDQARFLEMRLEEALGIEDRPVEGELRKPA